MLPRVKKLRTHLGCAFLGHSLSCVVRDLLIYKLLEISLDDNPPEVSIPPIGFLQGDKIAELFRRTISSSH